MGEVFSGIVSNCPCERDLAGLVRRLNFELTSVIPFLVVCGEGVDGSNVLNCPRCGKLHALNLIPIHFQIVCFLSRVNLTGIRPCVHFEGEFVYDDNQLNTLADSCS